MDNRAQVREFLASRRARITPDQAGLPAYGGNRRVKGLRREEVALLAGVSIDYYIRMERGDLAGASEAVLDGIANALQLDEAEREHLHALARSAGPTAPRRARSSPATVRPVIQQVLDAITEAPAWIRNARHDILALNPLARALYSPVLDSAVAGATAKRAQHHQVHIPRPGRPRVLRRLRPHSCRRRRHAPTRSRTQPSRQSPHHPRRRTLHPKRAVPPALGLAQRQIPPQRPQTTPPSRRRRARPQLRGHGAPLRARLAPQPLHR